MKTSVKKILLLMMLSLSLCVNNVYANDDATKAESEPTVNEPVIEKTITIPLMEGAEEYIGSNPAIGNSAYSQDVMLKLQNENSKKQKFTSKILPNPQGSELANVNFTNKNGAERKLSFSLLDNSKNTKKQMSKIKLNQKKKDDNKTLLSTNNSDIDIEYVSYNTKLKETIIINKPQKSYEYVFELNYDKTITLELYENSVGIFDNETNEKLGVFESPYVYDSSVNPIESKNVFYTLSNVESGLTILTVSLKDKEFLSKAKFPIFIDPTVNTKPVTTYATFFNTKGIHNNVLNLEDNEDYEDTERYPAMKFIVDVPMKAQITSAILYLFVADAGKNSRAGTGEMAFTVHKTTQSWNQYSTYAPLYGPAIGSYNYSSSKGTWITIDISSTVISSVDANESDLGIILIPEEISKYSSAYADFASPFINVSYIEDKNYCSTLENFYSWGSQSDLGINYSNQMYLKDTEFSGNSESHAALKFDVSKYAGTYIHSASIIVSPESVSGDYGGFNIEYGPALNSWNRLSAEPSASLNQSFLVTNNTVNSPHYADITTIFRNWINNPVSNFGMLFKIADVPSGTGAFVVLYSDSQPKFRSPQIFVDYSYEPQLVSTNIYNDRPIGSALTPQIEINDRDNDILKCEMFIDDLITPKETINVGASAVNRIINFSNIDPIQYLDGFHMVKFKITDPRGLSKALSYRLIIDKGYPVASLSTPLISANSISITANASDAVSGLSSQPYKFTFDGFDYGWSSLKTFNKSNLNPNTSYALKCEVTDKVGHITTLTSNLITHSSITSLSVNNVTKNFANMKIMDNNPANTQYLIMCNDKYVNSVGELTSTATWINKPTGDITIKNLSMLTSYSLKAKTRNSQNIESVFSSPVVFTTTTIAGDEIGTISAEKNGSLIKLNWSQIPNATSYDVMINATISNTNTNSYTFTEVTMPSTVYIRAIKNGVPGSWSNPLVTNFTKGTRVVKTLISNDSKYDFSIINHNTVNGAVLNYEIDYDGNLLSLYDGSLLTPEKEYYVNSYQNSYFIITKHLFGKFSASSKANIGASGNYSSVLNVVRLSRIKSGNTFVTITLYE